MILVDVNLLLYAYSAAAPEHRVAKAWLDQQLTEADRVGLPWPSLLSFMRLVTNPRIMPRPRRVPEAWGQVRSWLSAPSAWVPTPTDRHQDVLDALMPHVTSADLIPDAGLAALAIEHGLALASSDGDFARFPGLRWFNPITEKQ